MGYERLHPVVMDGELVALAGPERFHLIAPRLRSPNTPAIDLERVALLCLYHREVLLGRLPRTCDPSIPERWLKTVLELRRARVSGQAAAARAQSGTSR